jgi:hypothetical protein
LPAAACCMVYVNFEVAVQLIFLRHQHGPHLSIQSAPPVSQTFSSPP